jgi:hypothetical protein
MLQSFVLLQAGDNFQHELSALRRSVRYNEYAALEAPANPLARVSSTGCTSFVYVSILSEPACIVSSQTADLHAAAVF